MLTTNHPNDGFIHKNCKDCGKEFTISAQEVEWLKERGWELFERCADCRAKRKNKDSFAITLSTEDIIYRTCKDCGSPFQITPGEAESLLGKGLALPARCPTCREVRKRKNNNCIQSEENMLFKPCADCPKLLAKQKCPMGEREVLQVTCDGE